MKLSLKIAPIDDHLYFDGRHETFDDSISFDHPGFKISINVVGTTYMSVLLSAITVVPHRFWIYVDGVLSSTVIDTKGMENITETEFLMASNLDPAVSHSISLLKITEAQWNALVPEPNYVTFSGFMVDDGTKTLPFVAPARKIEFIGDSIQAGFCDMCDIDASLVDYAGESFGAAHPYLTCMNFNASCQTAAWSGYGVVRNCCGGETLMPEIHSRTLGSVAQSKWTPSKWIPDVVVVNLGDNDGLDRLNPAGDLEMAFVETYTNFIRSMALSYKESNPTFFLSCGPMSFG